jgi:3-hydroxybutyryl-CoA dehydrogenase
MAGLHFFFPVQLKNTVELIMGRGTSAGTISILASFLHSINKKPFIQKESNPFILNRLLLEIQAEAFSVYLEGRLTFSQIDGLVREHLFPGGIFSFFDHVGIDVMRASILNYAEFSPDKGRYRPLIDKLTELMASGRLGIKSKAGFYDYPPQPFILAEAFVDKEYEEITIRRLQRCFRQALDTFKPNLEIGADEFLEAVRDYLDLSEDPL